MENGYSGPVYGTQILLTLLDAGVDVLTAWSLVEGFEQKMSSLAGEIR